MGRWVRVGDDVHPTEGVHHLPVVVDDELRLDLDPQSLEGPVVVLQRLDIDTAHEIREAVVLNHSVPESNTGPDVDAVPVVD